VRAELGDDAWTLGYAGSVEAGVEFELLCRRAEDGGTLSAVSRRWWWERRRRWRERRVLRDCVGDGGHD
jgi:hypothetical protein